jgi:hypothetical protein
VTCSGLELDGRTIRVDFAGEGGGGGGGGGGRAGGGGGRRGGESEDLSGYLFISSCRSSFDSNLRRFTWGNPEIVAAEKRAKDDEKAAAPVEAKPVFELSGALARDTNKVNVGGGQIVVMK